MAKRSRGARSGGRRGAPRPARSRPGSGRPGTVSLRPGEGLSTAELERAAEIEARMLAEERAADQARSRGRTIPPERFAGAPGRRAEGPSVAERAANEYVYVVRDVRRIVAVAGGLVAVLAGLFVLIEVVRIGPA